MAGLSEYLNALIRDRDRLAENLQTMDVDASSDETFTALAEKVLDISSGVALPTLSNPATKSEILEGYEAIDQNGNVITGTLSEVTYVISEYVTFNITADDWDADAKGTTYVLTVDNYTYDIEYGLQLGLASDSSITNTQIVVEAALTLPYYTTSTSSSSVTDEDTNITTTTTTTTTTIYISAVTAPTSDITIAIYGLVYTEPVITEAEATS